MAAGLAGLSVEARIDAEKFTEADRMERAA
jgi:hypothetical protein